jgi:hypothetical protein
MDEKLPPPTQTILNYNIGSYESSETFYTPNPLNIIDSKIDLSGSYNYIEVDDSNSVDIICLPKIKDSLKKLITIRNKKTSSIVIKSNIDSTIEGDNQLDLFGGAAIQLLHNNLDYWIIL